MPRTNADRPERDAAGGPGGRSSRQREDEVRTGWRMAGIGFEVASEVAAGALIGWGVDSIAGTGRRWTLIGAIAGIVVGLFSLIRGTLKLNRELDRRHPTKGRGQPISDEEWEAWDDEDNDKKSS